MRALSVLLGLLTLASAGSAQDVPLRTLRDVKIGMARETVLAALSKSYDVTRMDQGDLSEVELVALSPKPNLRMQTESVDEFILRLPGGTIVFADRKVVSVETTLGPSLTSDDGVRFARQLFFQLYNLAEASSSSDPLVQRSEKVHLQREIVVPITLSQLHQATGDSYELSFHVGEGGKSVILAIEAPAGKQASVKLTWLTY